MAATADIGNVTDPELIRLHHSARIGPPVLDEVLIRRVRLELETALQPANPRGA
jgi:hypothetical protein